MVRLRSTMLLTDFASHTFCRCDTSLLIFNRLLILIIH